MRCVYCGGIVTATVDIAVYLRANCCARCYTLYILVPKNSVRIAGELRGKDGRNVPLRRLHNGGPVWGNQ